MVKKIGVLMADGRETELRIRSRRRVAVRADLLPNPPPSRMRLMCNGVAVELRLTWDKPTHGFYVYYVPAEDYDTLTSAMERRRIRCVLFAEHV
jgi:hypothetical protein